MLRQLLAFLALLSGLSAIGAPAQALIDSSSRIGVEQTTGGQSEKREARCACEEKQRKQKARGEPLTPCVNAEPVTVYLPTVMFGADRAYE